MIAWLSVPWRSKALEAYVQLQLNIYGKMIWSHCGVEILSSYLMSEPLGKYLDLSLPPPGYVLLFDVWWHLLQQAGSGALFSCSTQVLLKFFFDVLFFFFLCLNNFYQALRGFHLFILNSNWLSVGYLQLLSFWFQLVLIFFFLYFLLLSHGCAPHHNRRYLLPRHNMFSQQFKTGKKPNKFLLWGLANLI